MSLNFTGHGYKNLPSKHQLQNVRNWHQWTLKWFSFFFKMNRNTHNDVIFTFSVNSLFSILKAAPLYFLTFFFFLHSHTKTHVTSSLHTQEGLTNSTPIISSDRTRSWKLEMRVKLLSVEWGALQSRHHTSLFTWTTLLIGLWAFGCLLQ